jgi:hypothetical protein
MTQDHTQFYTYVRNYIESYPDAAAYLQAHVAAGIRASLTDALQRAADMETLFAVAHSKKSKTTDDLYLRCLRKWRGKTALNFDHIIKDIEDKNCK